MTLQHRAPAPNLAAIPAQLTAIALMAQAMRDMLSTGEYLPDYDKLLGRIGQHVDLHEQFAGGDAAELGGDASEHDLSGSVGSALSRQARLQRVPAVPAARASIA